MSKHTWKYGNPLYGIRQTHKGKRNAFLGFSNTQEPFESGKTYSMLWGFLMRGLSACFDPLDVLRYSPPASSSFAEVRLWGIAQWISPTLRWTRMLFLRELSPRDLIEAAARRRKPRKVGNCNSEAYGIASTSAAAAAVQSQGECGIALNRGYKGASTNVGSYGAAANTGNGGAATNTGENGIAVNASLCGGALNTGSRGLAVNDALFGVAASSGPYSLSINTAEQGVAVSTYERTEAANDAAEGIAAALGVGSRACSAAGGIIIVAWWDAAAKRKRVTVGYSGEDGIQSDAWYEADERGVLRTKHAT